MPESIRPLAEWDYSLGDVESLAWFTRLDERWQIEVQRSEDYAGQLCIFDHQDGDKLIHTQPVGLSFAAAFGPDMDNVREWRQIAIDIVDGLVEE